MGRIDDLLEASPAETTGLVVLLASAVAAAAVVWWAGTPAGSDPSPAPVPTGAPSPAGATPEGRVVVHLAGAVVRPGVVALPSGARVQDALAAAGGALPTADLDALNLARPVSDGERVVVPVRGAPGAAGGEVDADAGDGPVDLNAATAEQLEELPGIGPVLAARIVDHREEHGPFATVDDLVAVRGIGERLLADLRDLVVVR